MLNHKYKKQRISVSFILVLASLGIGSTLLVADQIKKPIKQHEQQESTNKNNELPMDNVQNDEESQEIEEQPVVTKEPEKESVQYIRTNEEGKKYSYDAAKITDKLKHYDYSNEGEKIVFLTFDDGASTTVTPQILKTLDEYDVKATFFVVGNTIENGGEEAKALIKEEFDKGHAIANHSYSHDYHVLYPERSLNLNQFLADFKKTDELLKDILGENFSTRVIRCPGGYNSWNNMEPLEVYLQENNIVSIDWNVLNRDAEGRKKDADELIQNVTADVGDKEIVVVLMHDTYGKEETAKALPQVIQYFKDNGYEFKTLV